jgi:hypothetical protein
MFSVYCKIIKKYLATLAFFGISLHSRLQYFVVAGFNVAVLFTNLSEHMPSDPRLAR